MGDWSKSCLWQFIEHQETFIYKPTDGRFKISQYTFKPVCRTTLETPWDKLQNLLGTKLTTDITLLFFPVEDNDIFVYFLCHRCGLWN